MSISNALNNAASGLSASSRLADTISNNVANAMTPGFGKRTTELSSLSLGGYGSGVRISGTSRAENPYLTAERRAMDAALGATATRSEAWDRMMTAFGEPGSSSAVSSLATALETSLMSASASPQSMAKLSAAMTSADSFAKGLNRVSRENAQLRSEADAEIGRQVAQVNDALHDIDAINRKISILDLQGADITGLQDERGRLVDQISAIVPLKTAKRDGGQIAIYAAGGGVLLDGRVWELEFQPAPNGVTSDMVLGAPLSGLAQDQGAAGGPVPIATGTGPGLMDGGSLGALFELRDRIVPEFDAEMDQFAAEIIDRFTALVPPGALDATGAGLFVDRNPGPAVGLAGRIALNPAADPSQPGGAAWRLRDGLAAAAPGNEGFGTYLQALSDAMTTARAPGGFVSQNASVGAATMASEIASFFAGSAVRSDEDRAFLTARQNALVESEGNETGVNTDTELQSLMLVEQTYAANARVLSVVDQLMQLLLEV